jgi:hypothetical protein
MAARKMVKVQDKWPNELYLMSGLRKKSTQIKRCMMHIFEFYEETFPDHYRLGQSSSCDASE